MRVISDQWSVVSGRRPASDAGRRTSNARAFTLFEIVLVLLVLGIAAAIVVPAVGNSVHSPRLRTAANLLASDIEFCQSECIAQPSAPRAVVLDVATNTYKITVFSTGVAIKHPADGTDFLNNFSTGRTAELAGVTISGLSTGNSATLTFDAYGRPLINADLVITLSYNGQTMQVTVKTGTGDTSISG